MVSVNEVWDLLDKAVIENDKETFRSGVKFLVEDFFDFPRSEFNCVLSEGIEIQSSRYGRHGNILHFMVSPNTTSLQILDKLKSYFWEFI